MTDRNAPSIGRIDESDRHWCLVALPASWLAAVMGYWAAESTFPDPRIAILMGGSIAAALPPLVPVLRAGVQGRIDLSRHFRYSLSVSLGILLGCSTFPLAEEYPLGAPALAVAIVGATYLTVAYVTVRELVVDQTVWTVAAATSGTGFLLSMVVGERGLSMFAIMALYFVYGFGVSSNALTWIHHVTPPRDGESVQER